MDGIFNHLGQHVHDIDKRPRVKAQLLRAAVRTEAGEEADATENDKLQDRTDITTTFGTRQEMKSIQYSMSSRLAPTMDGNTFNSGHRKSISDANTTESSKEEIGEHQKIKAGNIIGVPVREQVDSSSGAALCNSCHQRGVRRSKSPLVHNGTGINTPAISIKDSQELTSRPRFTPDSPRVKRWVYRETPAAYVLYARPDTPPKYLYQRRYMIELSQQLESKEMERRRKTDEAFRVQTESRRKATENYQKELKDKMRQQITNKSQYHSDLTQQVTNKPKQLPRMLSFNKEPVFGTDIEKKQKYREYENASSRGKLLISHRTASEGNPSDVNFPRGRRNAIVDVKEQHKNLIEVISDGKSVSSSTSVDASSISHRADGSVYGQRNSPSPLLQLETPHLSFEEWAHRYQKGLCQLCHRRLDM